MMDMEDFLGINEPPRQRPVTMTLGDLEAVSLGETRKVWVGRLPSTLSDPSKFGPLWDLHPEEFNSIAMFEKQVQLPRWQQAFGRDYQFSGQTSEALPIPDLLSPYLEWAQSLDKRLSKMNGLLLNWYDDDLKHYIGKHRDSEVGLVPGAPIITISLGGTRAFRLRPWQAPGAPYVDIEVANGAVLVIPWLTNRDWTHEVPSLTSRFSGRRISITIRAFQ